MRVLPLRAILASFAILSAGFLLVAAAQQQASAGVAHGGIAVEVPRSDSPIVLDGTVYSSIQLQDRVIVGGEFTRVQTVRNGPIVDRNNLFAYDINTGEIIDDFAPVVNRRVTVLEPSPTDDSFYLGGIFTNIDGSWHQRLAKLDYSGTLDTTFRPKVSAEVHTIELHSGVVYAGGSFAAVNDEPHDRIAAVDAATGATIAGFDLAITGDLGKARSRSVRHLEVHPNGQQLLVVSNGKTIVDANGAHDRFGIAFVDIDTYTVTPWRTQWYELAYSRCSSSALQIRDASFSPDGSQFAVVEKGGIRCDKIVSFNTADDGVNNPKWVTAAHDSVFSVEITDSAVYAGGHFCFVRAHGAIASTDAPTYPWVQKPEACQITSFGPGNQTVDDFYARQQIVALSPADGSVLDWNPRSNAQVAVHDITSIDRGLLIGQDGNGINNIETGRHAFLDFGGTTPVFNPPVEPTQGCIIADTANEIELEWLATDDRTQVRRDGKWLATVTGEGSFTDATGTTASDYVIRIREAAGTVDYPCTSGGGGGEVPPEVPEEPEPPAIDPGVCIATLDGDIVTLAWGDNGATSEVIRRNGKWIGNVTGQRTFTDTPGIGDHSYVLRLRIDGQTVDVTCDPNPVTIGEPEPVEIICTVEILNETSSLVQFTANTTGTQVLRFNDRWIATVNGLTQFTFTPTARQGGTPIGDYVLRTNVDGVVSDIPCDDVTPPPVDDGTPQNLALDGTATQSSTAHNGVASRAIDGNTSGVWQQGSVTHTQASNQPWWQVDLGANADISSVELWNRTNCCAARLTNVVIFVSDTDMTGRSLAELEADPSVSSYSINGQLGETTTADLNAQGQFVRVQLRGNAATLSLAEVIVIGTR